MFGCNLMNINFNDKPAIDPDNIFWFRTIRVLMGEWDREQAKAWQPEEQCTFEEWLEKTYSIRLKHGFNLISGDGIAGVEIPEEMLTLLHLKLDNSANQGN